MTRRLLLPLALLLAPALALAEPRTVTLDEAVATARARQPQLREARATTEAAEARADQQRSTLLPSLDAAAAYERATANVPGGDASWNASNRWSAGATASQILFDAGRLRRFRSARASAEAQRASEQASMLDVVANVRTAYFAARAARDLVGVARDTLANQEAHLRQVQAFVEVGTRPEIDLAQARADRANAQVQLIQAENADATARTQLAQAMGLDGPADLQVADDTLPLVPGEDGPLEPLVAEALGTRPELAAFTAQRRAQALAAGAAQAGWLPTVSAQTGLAESGPALDDTAWNWNATVNLGWNLFAGGLTRAQVREARANESAVAAQEDAFRIAVRTDVDGARRGVVAARAALDAAAEALAAANERLRLAEGRYRAGAGSIIELGDAQVAATTAAAQRVRADYDLASARATLLRALGRP